MLNPEMFQQTKIYIEDLKKELALYKFKEDLDTFEFSFFIYKNDKLLEELCRYYQFARTMVIHVFEPGKKKVKHNIVMRSYINDNVKYSLDVVDVKIEAVEL